MSNSEQKEVEKQIQVWLESDVIQPSYSDYAANVLFVPKKDNTKRLCIDYRKLNLKIFKDKFPIPNMEDALDTLQKGNIFTTLDMENGFFHVKINERSRKYTAFSTPDGHYEFKRVPFGLCNSPSIFCRFVNVIFKDLINKKIIITYMDDIMIIARNYHEAMERLRIVLRRAEEYNLKIKWKKCTFLQNSIEFLGQEIRDGFIRSSENKTKDVFKYPPPTNVKQIERFLGFTGYFRKFIQNYAIIARPLSDLKRKDVKFVFGPDQLNAFETLGRKVTERPVLRIYNPDAETQLHTDASQYGTSAILMQKHNNNFHPVYFMSNKTKI